MFLLLEWFPTGFDKCLLMLGDGVVNDDFPCTALMSTQTVVCKAFITGSFRFYARVVPTAWNVHQCYLILIRWQVAEMFSRSPLWRFSNGWDHQILTLGLSPTSLCFWMSFPPKMFSSFASDSRGLLIFYLDDGLAWLPPLDVSFHYAAIIAIDLTFYKVDVDSSAGDKTLTACFQSIFTILTQTTVLWRLTITDFPRCLLAQ